MKRHVFIFLSREELKQLRELMSDLVRQEKYHTRLQGNAILMSNQGKRVKDIAIELNRSEKTIYQWLRNYRRKGISVLTPRAYRQKLSREQIHELLTISKWNLFGSKARKEFYSRWTFRQMADWVFQKWNIKLSPNRIRHIVREFLRKGVIHESKPNGQ